MKWLLSLAAIALSITNTPAHAQGMIRATCTTKGGTTVHRQDMPEDASASERLAIVSEYPDAMCIFLKISDLPPEHRAAQTSVLPDEVLRGASGGSGTPDESLAAALNVLSGGDLSTAPNTKSFSNSFDRPVVRASSERERSRPLNLTVGIYRSVAMADVMSHWKVMQSGTKVLSRMTPSMAVVGDVTMLSIENVPDSEASELCEEAAVKGSGCIAAY